MNIFKKLPSESVMRKVLIAAILMLSICGALSLIISLQLINLPGICMSRLTCDRESFNNYRTLSAAIVWLSRVSILLIFLAGTVMALRRSKNTADSE